MNVGIGVVAVTSGDNESGRPGDGPHGYSRIAVIVAIQVLVPDQALFIDTAVAVVVYSVTDFGCTGIYILVIVIAVSGIFDITGRMDVGLHRYGRPVSVAIQVFVPDGTAFIHNTVAIVVDTITNLFGRRINTRIGIVAIAVPVGIPARVGDRDSSVGVSAVSIAVIIPVPGLTAFINVAVAVIVNTVFTDFRLSGIDVMIGIVAIRIVGYKTGRLINGNNGNSIVAVGIAVQILIPVYAAFVRAAVTIVVDAVFTDFGGSRVDGRVGIVTVTGDIHISGRLCN